MQVIIVATKTCNHRRLLEGQLADSEVPYDVRFFEDHPELVERFDLHLSPNVLLDEKVIFRATDEHRVPNETQIDEIRSRIE